MSISVSTPAINRALAAGGRALAQRENHRERLYAELVEIFHGSVLMNALDGTHALMPELRLVERAIERVLHSGILFGRDTQDAHDRMLMRVGADLEYLFGAQTEEQFRTRYLARCHFA